MIVLHYVVGLFHAAFFIEGHGVFIGDQIYRDVLLAPGQLMRGLHQAPADALVGIVPIHPQIGDIEPIGVICQSVQRAHQLPLRIASRQADGNRIYKAGDPLLKPLFGVLGSQVGSLEEVDISTTFPTRRRTTS